jgi:hypothetical protein
MAMPPGRGIDYNFERNLTCMTETKMSLPLAEALRLTDLEPGRTYHEKINGKVVEVRVLEDAPTAELAEQVMIEPWVDFPFKPVLTIQPQAGALPLPDPPIIPIDDDGGS